MRQVILSIALFMTFFSYPVFSQITITQADLSSYFSVGNQFIERENSTNNSVDIGNSGPFALDYSNLNFDSGYPMDVVLPSSTAYGSIFSNATIALHDVQSSSGEETHFWEFYSTDTELRDFGGVGTSSSFEHWEKLAPYRVALQTPVNLGSSWTSDYMDTTKNYVNGVFTQGDISHIVLTWEVNGYGTLTLPGGRTINVLRIKESNQNYSSGGYSRETAFLFMAKNGESIMVSTDDSVHNSGTINASFISWGTGAVTNVEDELPRADKYYLLNNYPNPFNPSTTISYYLPRQSKINITVYNSLGQFVQELVSGDQSSGSHYATFNAAGLSSGSYFYRLTANSSNGGNSYSSTGKMLLIK